MSEAVEKQKIDSFLDATNRKVKIKCDMSKEQERKFSYETVQLISQSTIKPTN